MSATFKLSLFILLSGFFLNPAGMAQTCPALALISNNSICISLVWAIGETPVPLPSTMEFDGTTYTYSNGLGVFGFPAVYTKPPGVCTEPVDVFTGILTVNYASGDISCEYGVVLALHNLKFNAVTNQSQNTLKWTVKEDQNSGVYEVQKSMDGINFNTLKSIPASGSSSYTYDDAHPLAITYYRLKISEKNTPAWFSKVVRLRNDLIKSSVSVYPNPNKGSFIISGITAVEVKTLSVIDVQGRNIPFSTTNINDATQSASIVLKNMATGVLFIQYFSGSTKVYTRLLIQ